MRVMMQWIAKEHRRGLWGIAALLLVVLASASMLFAGAVTIPHEFQNGEIADANQVNANFRALADAVNDNDRRVTILSGTETEATLAVNCNEAGQTLGQAVQQALPGTTIQVTGTCSETVMITKDDLTLEGQGDTVIDGQGANQPVITIDGARRVTIQDVTVQNGFDGIRVRGEAAVMLEDVTAENNNNDGIRVDENATVILTNCIARNNDRIDFFVARGSVITFGGTIMANSNLGDGISIQSSSSVSSLGAEISASNNGESGINIFSSIWTVFDGKINSSGNGRIGLGIFNNSQFIVRTVEDSATVQLENNVVVGLDIRQGSGVDSFPLATVTVSGNGTGMIVDDSRARLEQATITNNNNVDLSLSFGARVSIETDVVNANCDETVVLLRGVECIGTLSVARKAANVISITLPPIPLPAKLSIE